MEIKIRVINKLSDLLWFGKYRGMTIERVIKEDPQYLLWAEEKGIILLSNNLQKRVAKCASTQHSEWLREYCDNEQCVEF